MPLTVLITCFDISGDHNGYDLIVYARENFPKKFRFICIGGERIKKLESSDVVIAGDYITESSIGVIEGIRYVYSTLIFFKKFKNFLKKQKIDLLLCIDGQGRNLILGKIAKSFGIKTAYFFPPHVSIIGKWNIKKMKWFDLILNPFAADHKLYASAGHRSVYTGHPFQNFWNSKFKPMDLGKKYPHPIVGVFPGSRFQEIKTMLPVFLPTVKILQKKYPNYSWVLSLSHERFRPLIEEAIRDYKVDIEIIHDRSEGIMFRSYFILACSGTTTLKASFFGVPHFIAYRISWSTYLIVRFLIYVKYIGMVNIAAGRLVVSEFINQNLKISALVEDAGAYLKSPAYRQSKSKELIIECQNHFCNSQKVNPYSIIWQEISILLKLPLK